MNKRGQVTVFIIIAILIIGAVALFFTLSGTLKGEKAYSPEVTSVKNYIDECINDVIPTGIGFIGLQGGYNILPREYLLTEFSSVAYGYINGRNTLVTLFEMENQISSYVKTVLPLCVDEYSFPDLIIETGEPKIKTTIKRDVVLVHIDFPVTIEKGDSISEIRDFDYETFVSLGDMHNTAEKIIDEKLNSNYIDLTYLSELDYTINILPQDENVFIYSIIDEESELNELPYAFNFAVKK